MYHKILVSLDGSPEAEKVLPHVVALARCTGAEIILLRVPVYVYTIEAPNALAMSYGIKLGPVTEDRDAVMQDTKRYLNKLCNELIRLGVKVSVVVQEGEVAARIIEYARAAQVDLIAMTTHAPIGIQRLFFGNVVDTVMHGIDKPILLVRPSQ